MIKYSNYQVTFREVPIKGDKVNLVINLTNCPHKCKGCHSSYLWEDVGTELTVAELTRLMNLPHHKGLINNICFMGGDNDLKGLLELIKFVKETTNYTTCWYTGFTIEDLEEKYVDIYDEMLLYLDFLKVGPYKEELGSLDFPTTNQRFYKIFKYFNDWLERGCNTFIEDDNERLTHLTKEEKETLCYKFLDLTELFYNNPSKTY